jgi:transcriptional regulator with XRE-family HTH domain
VAIRQCTVQTKGAESVNFYISAPVCSPATTANTTLARLLDDRGTAASRQNGARKQGLMVTLREVRANRLLTMRELARQASVAASTVYLIESGRTTPRPSIVRRLAWVLDIDPHEVDEFRRAIEASQSRSGARRRARPNAPPPDSSGDQPEPRTDASQC